MASSHPLYWLFYICYLWLWISVRSHTGKKEHFFEFCGFNFSYTETSKYMHQNQTKTKTKNHRRSWNLWFCFFCFFFQTRNRFEGTRSEVEELMNKIRQNPKDQKRASQFTAEGYLYVQEKSKRMVLNSLGLRFEVVVTQTQVLSKSGKCSVLWPQKAHGAHFLLGSSVELSSGHAALRCLMMCFRNSLPLFLRKRRLKVTVARKACVTSTFLLFPLPIPYQFQPLLCLCH